MYSLVIAEDELMTRRSLVDMIKWNELGFAVDIARFVAEQNLPVTIVFLSGYKNF